MPETLKYKQAQENKLIQIAFHADRQLEYDRQTFFRSGYLFLQFIYYQLQLHKVCRKLKAKYNFKYDINAILSDLIYARILEPDSKCSSYKTASEFWEKPSITDALHDLCGFQTDYQFITKSKIKTIEKKLRGGNKSPYFAAMHKIAESQ